VRSGSAAEFYGDSRGGLCLGRSDLKPINDLFVKMVDEKRAKTASFRRSVSFTSKQSAFFARPAFVGSP